MEARSAEEGTSVSSPGTEFKFSPLHHAFLQRDRCLEASLLLHAILRKVHDETRPIFMLFLDLAKTFNTVSHEAILDAARRVGALPPLILDWEK